MLGLPKEEGYPTCLVNALLGITRLPGSTFLRHAWPVIVPIWTVLSNSELNFKHLKNKKLCSVYNQYIFLFFRELNLFSIENFQIISNFRTLQRMSSMTRHVSKAGKVDSGDRVTLPIHVNEHLLDDICFHKSISFFSGTSSTTRRHHRNLKPCFSPSFKFSAIHSPLDRQLVQHHDVYA